MPHRPGLRTVVVSSWFVVMSTAACGDGGIKVPDPEVRKSDVKLDIPKVPDFALPAPNTDGSHSVKEMRVKGKKLLETEVTVKGYVTWAYDCLTSVREPSESEEAARKRIDADPTICQRAKFYIGDEPNTPPEKSAWVVDVPRPYNKLELERIKKKDRNDPNRCEPGEKDPKKSVCPPYNVGDQVEVTGTWRLSSPHSERNSEGLLVYKKMKNVTQSWESPPPGAETTGMTGGGRPSPEDLVNRR
jgi:hypothetical protein